MSTTTATTRTTSSKAAQTELFRNLVEDLDHNDRQDLIIFLSKENKKNTTKTGRAKRAPKLDEDGNVIKKAISPGMAAWNGYVSYLKETLQELYPEAKITRKACLRLGKLLKIKGAAADEGENTFYPEDNLTTETLQAEWEEWSALPAEEQYPKKDKKGLGASAEGSDSEGEAEESEEEEPKPKASAKAPSKKASKKTKAESEDEAEAPKPKARGRPKKASPLDEVEDDAAQSSSETVSSKKSSKSAKSKAAEEEEAPKAKKVSAKASSKKDKAAESDAEEEKPKKKASKSKKE